MASAMQTEDFLAHFGVKGMKWGIRKKRDESGSGGGSSSAKTARTPEQEAARKARNKKIAIGVAAGTVVVGAAAATYILHKRGNTQLAAITQAAKNVAARKAREAISNKVNDSISNRVQNKVAPDDPSPADLRFQLGLRAQQQALSRARNQQLTEETWVNSAQVAQTSRQNQLDYEDAMASLQRGR